MSGSAGISSLAREVAASQGWEGAFVCAGAPAQSNSCMPSRGKGFLYLSTVCSILGLVCTVAFRAERRSKHCGEVVGIFQEHIAIVVHDLFRMCCCDRIRCDFESVASSLYQVDQQPK